MQREASWSVIETLSRFSFAVPVLVDTYWSGTIIWFQGGARGWTKSYRKGFLVLWRRQNPWLAGSPMTTLI